jgi:dTDP-glucose 4,6-dehydratase
VTTPRAARKPKPRSTRRRRVLITGGAGFIGSHLCDHFLSLGFEVICVDNLLTGSTDNIVHIRSPQFQFIDIDITRYIYIEGPIDYILHFASPASPMDYLELPIQTLKVGSLGTHKALGLAKAKGARLLLASTSEVYGDPLVHPQRESYWGNVNPVGPRGVYDEAKRVAAAMTLAYRTAEEVDTTIARIFNTYGPRMRLNDGRAIPAFMSQALTGRPITVFGDGRQTRSFCYVDDMVRGIAALLLSSHTGPMNLGNPKEMTLEEMARKVIEVTGSRSRIVHRPLPTDDPKVRQPDITLARKTLDWSPRIDLEKGLEETVAYFKTRLRTGGANRNRRVPRSGLS